MVAQVVSRDLLEAEVAATLQEKDVVARLGQKGGHDSARRASPDHHGVVPLHAFTSKPTIRQATPSRLPPLAGSL